MERKKIHQAQQAIVFSALLFTSLKVKSEPRDTTAIPNFSFYSQSTYSNQHKLILKPLTSDPDLSQKKKNLPKFNFIANEELGKDSVAKWTLHIQVSTVYQYHPAFEVPYSGAKSLSNSADNALSITHTIFLGRKLWKNAAFYFNPELTGGNGFNGVSGIAGFPNGEIYRVGNPSPTPFVARAFFQQSIPLSNSEIENLSSDIN